MEEDDPMVSCPFDSGHRHLRSRMPYHIKRCFENDPRRHLFVNKKQCAFDASHIINKKDYKKHLEGCPAAIQALQGSNIDQEVKKKSCILPVDSNTAAADGWGAGEWGNDANYSSYDPQEANQNREFCQAPIGLSKTERKKYRFQERRRINNLPPNGSGSSSKP